MGKTSIIIKREFNERVRKKSFILTTILTPLLFVGMMVAIVFMSMYRSSGTKEILVDDRSGIVSPYLENTANIVYDKAGKSFSELKQEKSDGLHEDAFGILVIGEDILDNPRNVQLYAYKASTMDLETAIARGVRDAVETEKLKAYDIENLPQILDQVKTEVTLQAYRVDEAGNEKESSSTLSMILSYIFGFLIYTFVFFYGAMVMQGVVEEKSSKVLEVMVSSVKPFQLMMGKIIGIACVAVVQFTIWMVVIFVGGSLVMSLFVGDAMTEAAGMMSDGSMGMTMGSIDMETAAAINNITDLGFLSKLFGGFVIFFFGGYLLYAAMFAAIGSAVDNVADSQQLQLPVTIPLFLAIIVMLNVMNDPHGPLAFWFGMIPFTSPIIMVARIPYGVPMWEMVLSVVLLYGTFIFMVWAASKIYRVGIFMYGKKPTLKELIKWTRYKY